MREPVAFYFFAAAFLVACGPPPPKIKEPNEDRICHRAEQCELWTSKDLPACRRCLERLHELFPDLDESQLPDDLSQVSCDFMKYLATEYTNTQECVQKDFFGEKQQ